MKQLSIVYSVLMLYVSYLSMEKFIQHGMEFRLEGGDLLALVKEQQSLERKREDEERENRRFEGEQKKLELELEKMKEKEAIEAARQQMS